MNRRDFTLQHRLRVRWSEVDMQGVVFNPQYLVYFDVAVAEYWRAMAASHPAALHDYALRLYTVKATIEFHQSAHYDEEIDVSCRVARIGRSSLGFAFGLWRGEQQLASGEIIYVYADSETKRPAPLPEPLRSAILGYERVPPEVAPGDS